MVGAEDGVPGMRNRIAVIPPPVMEAQYTETKNAIEIIGFIEYAKGNASATAIEALTPGMAPKITPIIVPATNKRKVDGVNTIPRPVTNKSNILMTSFL